MVIVKSGKNIIEDYILESYIQLYAASIGPDGRSGDFIKIFIDYGPKDIPFMDYYISSDNTNKIINRVLSTKYKRKEDSKTTYSLSNYEKTVVTTNILLGCSPCCNKERFLREHPNVIL